MEQEEYYTKIRAIKQKLIEEDNLSIKSILKMDMIDYHNQLHKRAVKIFRDEVKLGPPEPAPRPLKRGTRDKDFPQYMGFMKYLKEIHNIEPIRVSSEDIVQGYKKYLENQPKCPNCKEVLGPSCACLRNKCTKCGESVGNITFTVCDECWDKDV